MSGGRQDDSEDAATVLITGSAMENLRWALEEEGQLVTPEPAPRQAGLPDPMPLRPPPSLPPSGSLDATPHAVAGANLSAGDTFGHDLGSRQMTPMMWVAMVGTVVASVFGVLWAISRVL